MTKHSAYDHAQKTLLWLLFGLLGLWLALALAWWLSARVDYGYPLWYQWLAIDQHIERYAPANRGKRAFEQLTAAQHQQLFADIVAAVHNQGEGLAEIDYHAPGWPPQRLLIDTEIRHLQDVAALLTLATRVSGAVALLWLLLLPVVSRTPLPSRRARVLAVSLLLASVAALLLLAGPKVVFYQLHEWLFPPDNPWFFYWEESLMSTLMKAPVLFGAIAVQIAALAALLLWPLQHGGRYLGQRWCARRRPGRSA